MDRDDTPLRPMPASLRRAGLGGGFLLLLALLLASSPSARLSAQGITLGPIEVGDFPELTSSVIVFDPVGNPLPDPDVDQFRLFEDGTERTITALSCPPATGPQAVDIVFVVDKSGSMQQILFGGESALEMVRAGVDAFFRTYRFNGTSAVALVAFDDHPILLSDFRTSSPPLRSALDGLAPAGGTIFDPPLLSPVIGGISMLANRPDSIRRVVVFITDGEPETQPNVQSIVQAANRSGVEIVAVTIANPSNPGLARIAGETGGIAYDRVSTSTQLQDILRGIAAETQGVRPCAITWESDGTCATRNARRFVDVTYEANGAQGTGSYRVPVDGQQRLEVSERVLYFGEVSFPATGEREVTITARGAPFEITAARFDDDVHFDVASWGSTAPPFTLQQDESRTIRVRFAPGDTTSYGARLRFLAAPCPSREVLLSGRSPDTAGRSPLELLSPLGSETFDACDSVLISWTGVEPDRPVRISYTLDTGRTWNLISNAATGLAYAWQPPAPGTTYRIRISTDALEQHIVSTVAGGGNLDADTIFPTSAVLSIPMGLDIVDDTLLVVENGRPRVRAVDLAGNIITTRAGTGFTGNFGDGGPPHLARMNAPTGIFVSGDTVFVLEYSKIRYFDRRKDEIGTYGGQDIKEFAPDGSSLLDPLTTLDDPHSMVEDQGAYYISERGADRIRRIDKQTKVLTTIAGGGGNPGFDSDGRPATDAQLLLPRGITMRDSIIYLAEEIGHRIRRIDLRTGIINSVAGNGTGGYSGDGGPGRNAQLNAPTDVALWGDSLLVTEKFGHRIRLVDLKTGVISTFAGTGVDGDRGDAGPARSAQFSEPVALEVYGDDVYITERGNDIVRKITLYRPDGLDSTTSDFTVAAPDLAVRSTPIDLGPIAIGGRLDSLLVDLLCNDGTVPTTIDSIRIEGAHPDDFDVAGAVSEDELDPGACRSLSITFVPTELGERSARVILFGSCGPPDTLELVGTVVENCEIRSIDLIDFGELVSSEAGDPTRDSVVVDLLCNDGATAIEGTLRLFSPDGAFTILDGGGPFRLEPGECLTITLRYAPTELGRSDGRIDFGLPTSCVIPPTEVIGRRVRPATIPALAPIDLGSVCPDSERDTVVVIGNNGERDLFVTDISFVGDPSGFTLLDPPPSPSLPLAVAPGTEESVRLRYRPTSAGPSATQIRIVSNDPASPMIVDLSGRRDSVRAVPAAATVVIRRDLSAGYPRDTVIVVRNTGTGPISISSADLSGQDPAFFEVDRSSLPIMIPPGDSAEVPVRILESDEDRPYEAEVTLGLDGGCPVPPISVRLLHSGSAPLFGADDLTFLAIDCDQPISRDSILVLRNDGGSDLVISDAAILGDDPDDFILDIPTPITIGPGETVSIPVRFAPTDPGVKQITLRLTTATGTEDVRIEGERNQVAFTIDRTGISFDPALPSPNDQTVRLTNTGTTRIDWSLPPSVGDFTIVSVIPPSADPAESSTVTLRYDGPVTGTAATTLEIRELLCGRTESVLLQADDAPASVHLTIPHDTVEHDDPVSIPLRWNLESGVTPADSDSLRVTVEFIGTTFLYSSVSAGEIVAREYDQRDATTRLTIALRFGDRVNEELLRFEGIGLIGRVSETPLSIIDASWSRPAVSLTSDDGSLTVLGDCRDPGLHIEVRPPAIRLVAPQPARDEVRVVIVLDSWTSMQLDLVDASGRIVPVASEEYVPAGVAEVTIPLDRVTSGLWHIRVTTPRGRASRPLVIQP